MVFLPCWQTDLGCTSVLKFPKFCTAPSNSTKQQLRSCLEVSGTEPQTQGGTRSICASSANWDKFLTHGRDSPGLVWWLLKMLSLNWGHLCDSLTGGTGTPGLWWARLASTSESKPEFFICPWQVKFQRQIGISGKISHWLRTRFFKCLFLQLERIILQKICCGFCWTFQNFLDSSEVALIQTPVAVGGLCDTPHLNSWPLRMNCKD